MCTTKVPAETAQTTVVLLQRSIDKHVGQLIRKINIVVQVAYRLLSQIDMQVQAPLSGDSAKRTKSPSMHADAANTWSATDVRLPLSKGCDGRPALRAELLSPSEGSIGAFLLYDVLCQLQGVEGHVLRLLEQYSGLLETPLSSLEPTIQSNCIEIDQLIHEVMKQVNVLIQLGLSDPSVSTNRKAKAIRAKRGKEKEKKTKNPPPAEPLRSSTSRSESSPKSFASRASSIISFSSSSSSSSRRTSLPVPPSNVSYFSPTAGISLPLADPPKVSSEMFSSPSSEKNSPKPKKQLHSFSHAAQSSFDHRHSHSPNRDYTKRERKHYHRQEQQQDSPPHHHGRSSHKDRQEKPGNKLPLTTLAQDMSESRTSPLSPAPPPSSIERPTGSSLPHSPSVNAATPSLRFESNDLRQQLESFTFGSSVSAPAVSSMGEGGVPNEGDAKHTKRSPTYSSDDEFVSSSSLVSSLSSSRRYSSGRRYSSSSSSSRTSSSSSSTSSKKDYLRSTFLHPPSVPVLPGYPVQVPSSQVSPMPGAGGLLGGTSPAFPPSREAAAGVMGAHPPPPFTAPPPVAFFPSSELIIKEPPANLPAAPTNSLPNHFHGAAGSSNPPNIFGVIPVSTPQSVAPLVSSSVTPTVPSIPVRTTSGPALGCHIVEGTDI